MPEQFLFPQSNKGRKGTSPNQLGEMFAAYRKFQSEMEQHSSPRPARRTPETASSHSPDATSQKVGSEALQAAQEKERALPVEPLEAKEYPENTHSAASEVAVTERYGQQERQQEQAPLEEPDNDDLDQVLPGTNITKRDIQRGGGKITTTKHPDGTTVNVVEGADLRGLQNVVFGIQNDFRRR